MAKEYTSVKQVLDYWGDLLLPKYMEKLRIKIDIMSWTKLRLEIKYYLRIIHFYEKCTHADMHIICKHVQAVPYT